MAKTKEDLLDEAHALGLEALTEDNTIKEIEQAIDQHHKEVEAATPPPMAVPHSGSDTFTVARLKEDALGFFGQPRFILAGALAELNDDDEITLERAQHEIDEFNKRPAIDHGASE